MRRYIRRPPLPEPPPRKENAPCCLARRDHLGRFPVGFCSAECIRRPTRHLARRRHPIAGYELQRWYLVEHQDEVLPIEVEAYWADLAEHADHHVAP